MAICLSLWIILLLRLRSKGRRSKNLWQSIVLQFLLWGGLKIYFLFNVNGSLQFLRLIFFYIGRGGLKIIRFCGRLKWIAPVNLWRIFFNRKLMIWWLCQSEWRQKLITVGVVHMLRLPFAFSITQNQTISRS